MSVARISWISGPVLRARAQGPFRLREAVRVGERGLLGEVIRMQGDDIVAQVYEDTTGLRPGVEVRGSGALLGVMLGPALLGRIFDGLLRPLAGTATHYVEPGMRTEASLEFSFRPRMRPGEHAKGGAVLGEVVNAAGIQQLCLIPPDAEGEVTTILAAGRYGDDAPLCSLRTADGASRAVAMRHFWPVREPRPIAEWLPSDEPLITGQRVLDSIFPVALGGKAAIPGGFGTGKTMLLEALAKSCSADVIVYVGCGERGNEMAGVLDEFPRLADPRSGRPLMERTVIIANTSNMPVAAREASIYSAITVAEYFRDQGLHVALLADSTSRWAEALREVSVRFGELPSEGGYPPYLSSRIAEFYERAAKVRTLAGSTGSVTVLASISPPSGDFSEPVTSHTKRQVRSFWALDVKRAQARFYPAIHPLQSYSEDALDLAAWWGKVYADLAPDADVPANEWSEEWTKLRRRFLTLLDEQARLERMARIIGKDALPARQQLILFCAELVNEGFLRQSAFSATDRYCGPQRQARMMRSITRFIAAAEAALAKGISCEAIAAMQIVRRLERMGEDIAEDDAQAFADLSLSMESEFSDLVALTGAKREA
ncbi:MAG: V-type ATP synthase subunit A [Betaproteobacteria bacterium]|nr:V-type ATP synthase subunit A [Betaproteobacteria bacterium]